MAHEILSAKLNELDEKIGRLHSRIHISESENPVQLEQAVCDLRRECKEETAMLQDRLQYSKAEPVGALSTAYQDIEAAIHTACSTLQTQTDSEAQAAEEKILVAEYTLDFALQAADYALLCALDAIQTEKNLERSSR